MAEILKFNGQQVGTTFLRVETADHLVTPPVRRQGVMQDRSAVDASSRNRLHARLFHVMVKADSNVALDQLIAGIQSLAGREGDLEVFYDANSVMLCRDWIVDEVSTPRLLSGYGGRLCEELTITAVGSRPPLY